MSELSEFIDNLCNEIEILEPNWEDDTTFGYILPYLKKNKNPRSITPIKNRIRTVMREMRKISPKKYNTYNERFKKL